MSVQFNEEQSVVRSNRPRKASFFTGIVYKLKLAKTDEGAQRVILIAALLTLGIAIFLFLNLAGVV
ncbi:MAG: hypothetical protein V4681_03765 [Patescibacteria group bacterium]